jgi:hypothetical protein
MELTQSRGLLDNLPSLDDLAAREETVKVTITLSKLSVEFFKSEARARSTQYQKMIRRLLDEYVQRQTLTERDEEQ